MSDDIVVIDSGQVFETQESAIIAKNEADRSEQWAKYSEEKANLSDERAIDAAESSDAAAQAATAAIEAKEYAEDAITDENLITVATDLKATPSNIKTVAGSIANVNVVGGNIDNVNSVAENKTNINAVAGNEENINAVNANKTNINAVADNATNINAVAGNSANINAVNANKANIDIVSNNIDHVNDVAMIKDDVIIVSENVSDIMTVADNVVDVKNVSDNMQDVKAAVVSAANAKTSEDNAKISENKAQIWAEGEDPQVTGLGGEHSAKKWAELAGSIVNLDQASETVSGIVRLSTTAEAKEGFDNSTAITPLKLAQVVSDNVGRGVQLGFAGTLEGNLLTFETTDPSPYTLRHNYDYEIDLLFQAVGVLSDDIEVVIKNGDDYINIVNVLHDDPTTHITVKDLKQMMKYTTDIGWRWLFMARYTITANSNKVFVMPSSVVDLTNLEAEIAKRKLYQYEKNRNITVTGDTTVYLKDDDEIIALLINNNAAITLDYSNLTFPRFFNTIQLKIVFIDGAKTVSFTSSLGNLVWVNDSAADLSDGKAHWLVTRVYKNDTKVLISDAGSEG